MYSTEHGIFSPPSQNKKWQTIQFAKLEYTNFFSNKDSNNLSDLLNRFKKIIDEHDSTEIISNVVHNTVPEMNHLKVNVFILTILAEYCDTLIKEDTLNLDFLKEKFEWIKKSW